MTDPQVLQQRVSDRIALEFGRKALAALELEEMLLAAQQDNASIQAANAVLTDENASLKAPKE